MPIRIPVFAAVERGEGERRRSLQSELRGLT
jgi:hypothetical protein